MMHSTLPEPWPEAWIAAAATLRAKREAIGLSLDQLAACTRIGRTHLEAIEAGRFDRCGAPIYAIGFTRSIARVLDTAEAPILAAIRAGNAERTPHPPVPATPSPARRLVPDLGFATTGTLLLSLLGASRG
ncbi:helix-turn-helix transcriptional regulator [uncultured Sphingomonas sp.]|uniref:helix-turn-helix domain-containing protein n=1 Tax=uncultured Sphingomonas sp. TaxID=158754 RepID=UPI0025D75FB3|nr:helix-turn-helix transcriptional regulator [uncultured Sphingomonas sp.]